jgi:amino acid transporter
MPGLSLGMQIGMGITLTWIAVGLNSVTLRVGKWVPNLGAILKIIVIVSIMVGAAFYTRTHGMANPLTLETMLPTLDTSVQYLSVIIYGLLGFELASAGSDEMKNPARDVPRAILVSGLIIIVMYTSATVAILAAIPAAEIDLVEGLMDTLNLFFGATAFGRGFALALGVAALFTFFSNGVTWSLGCNRAMAEAAREREFPALLAVEHRTLGTPVGAAVVMGIVSTVVLLLYGLVSGSNADLFWSLFAFSAVIFLIPYIMLVFSFAHLRRIDPDRHRPYRVPGGDAVARLLSWVCGSLLILALILFVYTPGAGIAWPVLTGAIAVLTIGEITIRITEKARHADGA